MDSTTKTRPIESIIVIAFTLIATFVAICLASRASSNTQDWENWVELDSKERLVFEQFKRWFGANDYVIASWPGCSIDDPRLGKFAERLRDQDSWGLIENVVNGEQAVRELVKQRDGYSSAAAKRRLKNIFFGDDLELTCTVIELSQRGSSQRRESIKLIEAAGASIEGLGLEQLKLGGNARVNVELDRQTNSAMLWSIPAILCSIMVAWLVIGELRLTLIALSVGGLSALFSIALVIGSGHEINGLLVLMPVLVQTVTLSSAVHMLGYYRTARLDARDTAHQEMVAIGWKPTTFAMVTSAIGVGSLAISRVPAVHQFGIFSAGSILIGLILLFLVFPNALNLFAGRRNVQDKMIPQKPSQANSTASPKIGGVRRLFLRVAMGHPKTTTLVFLLLCILGAIGVHRLRTNLQADSLFSAGSQFAKDTRWFQEQGIALRTIEVIVSFGSPEQEMLHRQLWAIRAIQHELLQRPEIKSAFSTASLIKTIPGLGSDVTSIGKRTVFNDTLIGRKDELIEAGLLAVVDGQWLWRVTLSCDSEIEIERGEIVRITENPNGAFRVLPKPKQIMVTGMVSIAAKGHERLFEDLSKSFLLALAIITPMMIVLLRSLGGGLMAMLPNVFPPVVLFGFLGWIQYPVDVGMILTASVGLGIAVDNTFHFLHKFRAAVAINGEAGVAVKEAFYHCSTPMLQTASICCFGLAIFAFADFIPVRQFALAIVAVLLLAILADLLLLPALASLNGGRHFVLKNPSREP